MFIVAHPAAVGTLRWLARLGAPGLVLLGIADSSVIPLTGSMDVLTIWLAASHRSWWLLYAAMAALGAVLGGYITYRIARKGGKQALERKFSKRRINKVYKKFERWGFGAVAVPAMLPPPFPMVPFLLAAGAMQYPEKKFLGALALGRSVRFTIIAALGAIYGRHIISFFRQYYAPALAILLGIAVIGGIASLIGYMRLRHQQQPA